MPLLSNTFIGKLKNLAKNNFYKKRYSRSGIFLREIYFFLLRVCGDFIKILKYGTTDMFDEVLIETTTYCNRRCPYCPNSVSERSLKENEQLMPVELFKKIIDELKSAGFKGRISPHSYGEPVFDKRLPELMGYVRRNLCKARVVIFTNGDFLDVDILDRLYEVGVRFYNITIHGDAKNAENRINALKKYVRDTKKRIVIDCHILQEYAPLSTRAGLVSVENSAVSLPCIDPLTIDFKGDVLICCNDYRAEAVFGNLKKEKLMDIWNKPYFKKVRRQLRDKEYALDICKRCTKSFNRPEQEV